MRALVAALVIGLGLGFLAGWNVNGWRYRAAAADNQADQAAKQEERAETVDKASEGHETDKEAARVEFKTIYRDVEKIVERPVYRNRCLDADGLRALSAALGKNPGAASEPQAAVPGPRDAD